MMLPVKHLARVYEILVGDTWIEVHPGTVRELPPVDAGCLVWKDREDCDLIVPRAHIRALRIAP